MAKKLLDAKSRAELQEFFPSISEEEFVKEAVREKIEALKLSRVLSLSHMIKSGMRARGTSPEKVLRDFDKTT